MRDHPPDMDRLGAGGEAAPDREADNGRAGRLAQIGHWLRNLLPRAVRGRNRGTPEPSADAWAAQSGWLDADPKGEKTKQSRGVTNRALRSRLRQPLDLPDIPEEDRYLVAALYGCGIVKPGAMGTVPLEWPDLLAYAMGTGAIDRGTDVSRLHAMCRAYWSEHEASCSDALRIDPVQRGIGDG